jgi:rubredoxin
MSNAAMGPDGRPWRTYMCVVCGFLYKEVEGWPQDGIAPGTRWEDIPDTWTCPDCGVSKADFELLPN